jgi:hypothetical protein
MRLHRKLLGQDFARRWAPGAGTVDEAGTAGGEPRGTRVLIEEPDGAEGFAYWHLLTDNGYSVQWCPGPQNRLGRRCPLVSCGQCELVERADVVVSSLGIDNEPSRKVLEALREVHPETPVIVEASRREFARWAPLFEKNSVLRSPVTAAVLLDSVEDALAHRP